MTTPTLSAWQSNLLESGKQTSQSYKNRQVFKKQKENLEKVNNVIKQLKAVKEIRSRTTNVLSNVMQNDLREILNSPYIKPDEVTRISESFNAIIENSLGNMDFIDQILSSDYMKMTDAERAEILKRKNYNQRKWYRKLPKNQTISRYYFLQKNAGQNQ